VRLLLSSRRAAAAPAQGERDRALDLIFSVVTLLSGSQSRHHRPSPHPRRRVRVAKPFRSAIEQPGRGGGAQNGAAIITHEHQERWKREAVALLYLVRDVKTEIDWQRGCLLSG